MYTLRNASQHTKIPLSHVSLLACASRHNARPHSYLLGSLQWRTFVQRSPASDGAWHSQYRSCGFLPRSSEGKCLDISICTADASMVQPIQLKKIKKPQWLMPMRPSFSPQILSLVRVYHTPDALQARSWPIFWLMNWGAHAPAPVFRLPSFPVTGSLHEYRLLHIQQRAKLRTLTGFPDLRTCQILTVLMGDVMQLIHLRYHYTIATIKVNRNRPDNDTFLSIGPPSYAPPPAFVSWNRYLTK